MTGGDRLTAGEVGCLLVLLGVLGALVAGWFEFLSKFGD